MGCLLLTNLKLEKSQVQLHQLELGLKVWRRSCTRSAHTPCEKSPSPWKRFHMRIRWMWGACLTCCIIGRRESDCGWRHDHCLCWHCGPEGVVHCSVRSAGGGHRERSYGQGLQEGRRSSENHCWCRIQVAHLTNFSYHFHGFLVFNFVVLFGAGL